MAIGETDVEAGLMDPIPDAICTDESPETDVSPPVDTGTADRICTDGTGVTDAIDSAPID